MPQACSSVMPYRFSYASISEAGQADPPTIASLSEDTSASGVPSRWLSSACQIVGTPAALLGRAAAMNSASGAAARYRSGIASDAPVRNAA